MDVAYSESERLIKEQSREVLERLVPISVVEESEASGQFPRSLWATVAQQGWFGLAVPEEHGGAGGTMVDLVILLEEMGRVAIPLPVAEQAAVAVALSRNGAAAGAPPITAITSGEAVVSVAVTDAPGVTTTLTLGSLSGEKVLVPYGLAADQYLVFANAGTPAEAYALAARSQPAVRGETVETVSMQQHARVVFSGAAAGEITPGSPGASSSPRELYTLARDAVALGLMSRLLELSIGYVKDRVQFGRPIGSFQAVQHHCADMALAYYGAQSLVWQAAWHLGENRPSEFEAACAHVMVRDAVGDVTRRAHQVHGAMGFTAEYPLQYFSRRAKAYQYQLKSAAQHREVVARHLGGAPAGR
jgi:alkylation response protein AidB-like acyl-CoA dehydrogenase